MSNFCENTAIFRCLGACVSAMAMIPPHRCKFGPDAKWQTAGKPSGKPFL